MSEIPFHQRPQLVDRCAKEAFYASFGPCANAATWAKQSDSFRKTFRAEAKAVLAIAWELHTKQDTPSNPSQPNPR